MPALRADRVQTVRTGRDDCDPARLLATLDCLRVALTIFDAAGCLIYANAHFHFLFAFMPPLERLLGKPYEHLIRLELASGAIAPAALAGGTEAFIADRLSQLHSGEFTPRDIALADNRMLEIKARRAEDGNTVLIWSDVTRERAQFTRLQEAIALTADAFAFYDPDDRFVACNALYEQLAGVRLEEIRGAKFIEVAKRVVASGRIVLDMPPDEWLARRTHSHRAPASALTIRTVTGKAYLMRDRATPDGGRALVFTDITDKTRTEAALAEQVDALARTQSALEASRARAEKQNSYLADLTRRLDQASTKADLAKTTLLRTMSHELKTPLNAILGFSDLMATLADRLSPAQIREYAGLVHQGGNNLLRMITHIMDLTKISAGRYELYRGPVDAGSLLWLAREAFAAQAETKSIILDAGACPAGLMVDADEAVFTAMLHNLLDNALNFTPAGGAVRLSAAAQADGIAIRVADNGPGVAAGDLERILEPFEHAGAPGEHAKGAGLGLTLVKAFAELHGGRLLLESKPGEGFCAILLMPCCP